MIKPYIIEEGVTARGEQYVKVGGCGNFSVMKTFDCGQAFRFDPVELPGYSTAFSGIAFGRHVTFCEDEGEFEDGTRITVIGSDARDFESIWCHYLALDTDYDEIDRAIVESIPDPRDRDEMRKAVECGSGIRILRQDSFECLISFIISQNNNIPRIKKIITSLCEKYGENGAFPTAEALSRAGVENIFALRTGFRAGYIYDAAEKVLSGEVDLAEIDACEDYDRAAEMLCRIKGVGPKVSACVLLFGFGKTEAFPIDVWMRRSLERHFTPEFDPAVLKKNAGIAQQYLFYYERWALGGDK
ncbi:MAG: DNA-3-methyladenine glycosylase 2 family protein [Clostridia bacterium]|nr:DNA-3-methyladenine glycosylase 2 family protein [Clostridia bacterium]